MQMRGDFFEVTRQVGFRFCREALEIAAGAEKSARARNQNRAHRIIVLAGTCRTIEVLGHLLVDPVGGLGPIQRHVRDAIFYFENYVRRHPAVLLYSVRYQSASAAPISCGESSWMKCTPFTVISRCWGHLRQNSRCSPTRIAPGSALMKSLGIGLCASHFE